MFYRSFQFLIILFSLSHTSHSTRMHDFNSIVITRVQNMWHFHVPKSLWLIGENEKCTVSTDCPIALPQRMSPTCSQAEKHTQIPSNVNQSRHLNGRFHSLLCSFTAVNILQTVSRRGERWEICVLLHWETDQTHLCIKITADGSNLI